MKVSLNCCALKCKAVGIRRVYSSEPWVRMSGRKFAAERGVEMPVCWPDPYMLSGLTPEKL